MIDWLFWELVTFLISFICYFIFWLSQTPNITTEYKFLIASELLTLIVIPFFKDIAFLEVFWFTWHLLWYCDPFKLKERGAK